MSENAYTSDALIIAAESTPTTYFMKLNELIDEDSNRVFCFVEGVNDMKYYYGRILNICQKTPREIICDGKANVIIAHEEISSRSEMSRYTIRYFVDADFDDNTHLSKDICYTEGYSIENYYGLDAVVSQMLNTAYCLTEKKDVHSQLMQIYKSEKAIFLPAILLFNAWYASLHDFEEWINGNLRIRLKDNFPSELLSIGIGKTHGTYSLNDIVTIYPNAPIPQSDAIKKKEEWIMQNLEMRIRGKYIMQFLRIYLQYINEKNGKEHKPFFAKGKHIMSECADTILNDMSQYAYTPESLIEYIKTGQRNN